MPGPSPERDPSGDGGSRAGAEGTQGSAEVRAEGTKILINNKNKSDLQPATYIIIQVYLKQFALLFINEKANCLFF